MVTIWDQNLFVEPWPEHVHTPEGECDINCPCCALEMGLTTEPVPYPFELEDDEL